MGGKSLYKRVLENSTLFELLAGAGAAAYLYPDLPEILQSMKAEGVNFFDFSKAVVYAASPLFAYAVAAHAFVALTHLHNNPISQRIRDKDYKKMHSLMKIYENVSFSNETLQEQTKFLGGFSTFNRHDDKDTASLLTSSIHHFNKRNYEDAILTLRVALDSQINNPVSLGYFSKINAKFAQKLLTIERYLNPREIRSYLVSAALHAFENPKLAYRMSATGRDITAHFDKAYKREAAVMHAILSSSLGSSLATNDWCIASNMLRTDPVWERIGESRSIVRTIKDSKLLSSTILFKEKESRESLVAEARTCRELSDLVDADFPEVLYVSEEPGEGRYFSVMRVLQGETLYRLLEDGKDVPLDEIVDILAKIHLNYKPGSNRIDIRSKVQSKLFAPEFHIPKKTAQILLDNWHAVYYGIINNTFWVYNKDAHPENWLVGNRIGVIDCEPSLLIPAQFDLANLLEYSDNFDYETKLTVIKQYHGNVKHALDRNLKQFLLGYHNSVLQRMVDLSSAWSSPERPTLRGLRKSAISRGLLAIDLIKDLDPAYYRMNDHFYKNIAEGLHQVSTFL